VGNKGERGIPCKRSWANKFPREVLGQAEEVREEVNSAIRSIQQLLVEDSLDIIAVLHRYTDTDDWLKFFDAISRWPFTYSRSKEVIARIWPSEWPR